jgi:hypothetical protein
LIPELEDTDISYAATTTTGRDNTIPFKFDPSSGDAEPYKRLPAAQTVIITFPLVGHTQSKTIVGLYRSVHGAKNNWVQLGSTGIFNKLPDGWSDDNAPYDKEDKRAIAEDELLSLHGCVLNLCGLYGGERVPARWLPRIVQSKDDVRKRGAVHFIHGEDVARAIIATHRKFTPGKRWIVADLRVYENSWRKREFALCHVMCIPWAGSWTLGASGITMGSGLVTSGWHSGSITRAIQWSHISAMLTRTRLFDSIGLTLRSRFLDSHKSGIGEEYHSSMDSLHGLR